jgi:hypothetical protein
VQQNIVMGSILTAVSIVSMVGGYVTSQVVGPEHRITAVEVKETAHEQADERLWGEIKEYRQQIDAKLSSNDTKLDRIERKLDRAIEWKEAPKLAARNAPRTTEHGQ